MQKSNFNFISNLGISIQGVEYKFNSFSIRASKHAYLPKQRFYNRFNKYKERKVQYQLCFLKRFSIALVTSFGFKDECF